MEVPGRPNSVPAAAGMGHMSGMAEPWMAGFQPATTTLALPLWSAAVVALAYMGVRVFVLSRSGREGIVVEALSRVGLLLVVATIAWVVLEATSAGSIAAQRRALDARLLELTTRAVMPGSPLACLDATAGELVEASCEKALFATPEAVAASVAYVIAQLSCSPMAANTSAAAARAMSRRWAVCAARSRPTGSASWPMCWRIATAAPPIAVMPSHCYGIRAWWPTI